MKTFDVQGIALDVPRRRAFAYVADPSTLPLWTHAFESVENGSAVLRTPNGSVPVKLRVDSSAALGTVDWRMTFPDGSVAAAHSRLVDLDDRRCVLAFVLTPPPVPLEELEGALEAQSAILTQELAALKTILEKRG